MGIECICEHHIDWISTSDNLQGSSAVFFSPECCNSTSKPQPGPAKGPSTAGAAEILKDGLPRRPGGPGPRGRRKREDVEEVVEESLEIGGRIWTG